MVERSRIPDEELMGRVGRGDLEAFEELVRRYGKRVLNFANQFVRDRAAAEDLHQQTFLKLFEAAASYKPTGSFPAYLFRIARNLSLNEIARRRPQPAPLSERASGEPAPPAQLQAREESDRVRRTLESLPPRDREIIWLRTYEKMSYREISELTGVKEDTARSRMRYALRLLEKRLGRPD
jgi:RNA polymerase sigma-70 factor (ECF subfamily)